MKLLFLAQSQSDIGLDRFYLGLHKAVGSIDMRRLDESQQLDLKDFFELHIDLEKYDRIVLHLEFDFISSQVKFLQSIPNLILIDHEVYKNYIAHSLYKNKYLKFFKLLPWVRVIVSGYQLMDTLQKEGLDAWCVPNGFDCQRYKNIAKNRNADFTLLSRSPAEVGTLRQEFTEKIKSSYPDIKIIEKPILTMYHRQLNYTKIFICPDIGIGEYRPQNFEAMACGALLMTHNQGEYENKSIGFKDMENVVLFKNYEDFEKKLRYIKKHPELIKTIASNGQQFVNSHFSLPDLGQVLAAYIDMPLREPKNYQSGVKIFGFSL